MTPNETVIIRTLDEMIRARELPVPVLAPETPFDSSLGLESLDLAELVVRMEEATGKDPFQNGVPAKISTIADLAALYDESEPSLAN